jgi:hypothetical protein
MHITLPAHREIIVGHTRSTDSRFTDLTFAINDAFKRALRKLREDTAQRNGRTRRNPARLEAEAT